MIFHIIIIKAKSVWAWLFDKAALKTALQAAISPTVQILSTLALGNPIGPLWCPVASFVLAYLIHRALMDRADREVGQEGLEDRALPDDICRLYYA
ncbi:hypothetical protein S7711_10608 [Stachybotrys chartarum IBT 7711]|uniref:Uncharacterized protein n=1 Tax=Stachybotrys chartarum (strain CBS 109288 / IBT 7711) TaxID=1280523 RepID=A0A084AYZ4_STACB|nr:hypothetical protein S7711_10608 [Stachybotrys chartarum IBT 7711]KFA54428.1 hypothetical protein S40293_10805 [Stachybotrys chartarum IBT 40293]